MQLLDDLFITLRFFSRLPIPEPTREQARGLVEAAPLVPWAGACIGAGPAILLAAGGLLGLPPFVAAALSLTASILLTGALHEDALADCADGFGGGATRERKLEIMRDSRIGAFGACALVLSLMLRVGALAAIAPYAAGWVVIGAAAMSRAACLLPLAYLPPARADGMGAGAARPRVGIAIGGGVAILFAIGSGLGRPVAGGVAVVAGLAGALAVCRVARAQIGGQTGDVAGAVQQIVEMAVLIVFAAGSNLVV